MDRFASTTLVSRENNKELSLVLAWNEIRAFQAFCTLNINRLNRRDRETVNTRITYLYRDASNYKQSESIVVQGKLTFAEVEPYLDEGEYFIPGQVGLEDLQHRFGKKLTTDDHPWHELNEDDFELTDAPPTLSFTSEELLERFRTLYQPVLECI